MARQLTLSEHHAELKAQGVADNADLAFRCPCCSTIQSARSLIKAGAGADFAAVQPYIAFSCVGRFTGAGPHRNEEPDGQGCDWTLGGLFRIHTLVVITDDGEPHPQFEPATPAEARRLEQQAGETFAGEIAPETEGAEA